MRRFIAAAAFLAIAVPIARADEKDATKLEGNYEVVSVLIGGKPDDKKKDEVKSFVIKDGMITVKANADKEDSVKFTVDPTKKPAHIDIMPGGEEKVLGIYETKDTDKGTELTIAFKEGPKGGDRPKDFKGEGKDDFVIKLFRKK
jgi:uncharacterized protein (TIGR03067 family)